MEIDRCLNSKKKFWSKQELLQALRDKDFDISESTLEKDIRNMRWETSLPFENAPIKYISKAKPYHYDREFSISIPVDDAELHALDIAVRTLNQFKDIEYFSQFAGAVDKVIRFVKQIKTNREDNNKPTILFEKVPYLKGYEYLDHILNAIENKRCVQIDYKIFGKEVYVTDVHPYFVKEFHNRWYVVGYSSKHEDLRTFALDRIENLIPCQTTYMDNSFADPEEYFKDCIGINFADRNIEKVHLLFSPFQGNYIKTQHLHRSQEIIRDDDKGLLVELNIIVNQELKMLIMSFGDQVKVLEPLNLAKDIAAISRRVAKAYRASPQQS